MADKTAGHGAPGKVRDAFAKTLREVISTDCLTAGNDVLSSRATVGRRKPRKRKIGGGNVLPLDRPPEWVTPL